MQKARAVLTVDLKALQDRASEAARYLKSKTGGKLRTKGTVLQIEGARTKDVRLLLHKFLHHQGMDNYRVLSQSGTLEVIPPEKHTVHEQAHEGTPPTAPQAMPYYFPQAPVLAPEKTKTKNRQKQK